MKTPCLNCNERKEHCHSNCEAYREFRKKNIEANKLRKQETQKNAVSKMAVETRKRRNHTSIFKTHRR